MTTILTTHGPANAEAPHLSLRQCVSLACILECTAPKPGNVHRGSDFEDLSFVDFLASAIAISEPLAYASDGVGGSVMAAVNATQGCVKTNANLGIVLLLAPLAAVPRGQPLREGVKKVLANLSSDDSRLIYDAIRLVEPGGLGEVEEHDVHEPAPQRLLDAMEAAADRDSIAYQYAHGYETVFDELLPDLMGKGLPETFRLTDRIVHAHVASIARRGDTLIARKAGAETSEKAKAIAKRAIDADPIGGETYHRAIHDLDFWMRSQDNRRNPGTTADLVAAALFAGLRDGLIPPPWR
ncbi:MAG TPA: triphosphoribosyl-dephospho-CoA synthase [Pirellulaceae bacterium]|jgi:triphosphoribosyl-dephospho-CoA synthase|nr:triphosphoribosyl-dephospho-CoA synthase [Pirellulaceae bacterium]